MEKEKTKLVIRQNFSVHFSYDVHFTRNIFDPGNPCFHEVISSMEGLFPCRSLVLLDEGLVKENPFLPEKILAYCSSYPGTFLFPIQLLVLPGGEACKNDPALVEKILFEINMHGVCRHSFLIAAGGGALLDLAGYAAAIAHRGIRHIRIPTTVLSQNDSGVGVKNGINCFDKKNFKGTFSPPFAVINDSEFLKTLGERDWRAGIAEAIKVALIKDEHFFYRIEKQAADLILQNMEVMEQHIYECAKHHLQHIASGDPFEKGSSRPLDFGHWAAHKLEQITNYSLRHGEAVAIGIALDSTYSFLTGYLKQKELDRILGLLHRLGFKLFIPEIMQDNADGLLLLNGLQEFREHLGGKLTVMLLESIGKGVEANHIDSFLMKQALQRIEQYEKEKNKELKYAD